MDGKKILQQPRKEKKKKKSICKSPLSITAPVSPAPPVPAHILVGTAFNPQSNPYNPKYTVQMDSLGN